MRSFYHNQPKDGGPLPLMATSRPNPDGRDHFRDNFSRQNPTNRSSDMDALSARQNLEDKDRFRGNFSRSHPSLDSKRGADIDPPSLRSNLDDRDRFRDNFSRNPHFPDRTADMNLSPSRQLHDGRGRFGESFSRPPTGPRTTDTPLRPNLDDRDLYRDNVSRQQPDSRREDIQPSRSILDERDRYRENVSIQPPLGPSRLLDSNLPPPRSTLDVRDRFRGNVSRQPPLGPNRSQDANLPHSRQDDKDRPLSERDGLRHFEKVWEHMDSGGRTFDKPPLRQEERGRAPISEKESFAEFLGRQSLGRDRPMDAYVSSRSNEIDRDRTFIAKRDPFREFLERESQLLGPGSTLDNLAFRKNEELKHNSPSRGMFGQPSRSNDMFSNRIKDEDDRFFRSIAPQRDEDFRDSYLSTSSSASRFLNDSSITRQRPEDFNLNRGYDQPSKGGEIFSRRSRCDEDERSFDRMNFDRRNMDSDYRETLFSNSSLSSRFGNEPSLNKRGPDMHSSDLLNSNQPPRGLSPSRHLDSNFNRRRTDFQSSDKDDRHQLMSVFNRPERGGNFSDSFFSSRYGNAKPLEAIDSSRRDYQHDIYRDGGKPENIFSRRNIRSPERFENKYNNNGLPPSVGAPQRLISDFGGGRPAGGRPETFGSLSDRSGESKPPISMPSRRGRSPPHSKFNKINTSRFDKPRITEPTAPQGTAPSLNTVRQPAMTARAHSPPKVVPAQPPAKTARANSPAKTATAQAPAMAASAQTPAMAVSAQAPAKTACAPPPANVAPEHSPTNAARAHSPTKADTAHSPTNVTLAQPSSKTNSSPPIGNEQPANKSVEDKKVPIVPRKPFKKLSGPWKRKFKQFNQVVGSETQMSVNEKVKHLMEGVIGKPVLTSTSMIPDTKFDGQIKNLMDIDLEKAKKQNPSTFPVDEIKNLMDIDIRPLNHGPQFPEQSFKNEINMRELNPPMECNNPPTIPEDLKVAIIDESTHEGQMTISMGESIRKFIMSELDKFKMTNLHNQIGFSWSDFKNGHYRLICSNYDTLDWLYKIIDSAKNLWKGVRLRVVQKSQIFPLKNFKIELPLRPLLSVEAVLHELQLQNPYLLTNRWTVFEHKEMGNRKILFLGIDLKSIEALKRTDGYAKYFDADIFFQFVPNDNYFY